jgi:hypothetical protein
MSPTGATTTTSEAYWPGNYIDRDLVGCSYRANEELGVAAFMAGSLRHIILSPQFARLPRLVKQKLKHLSFLMHVTVKYDNFRLVYSHHCAILAVINGYVHMWEWLVREAMPTQVLSSGKEKVNCNMKENFTFQFL